MNEFLSWNESDFCGIDKLAVPRKKLWTPDIYIQEEWVQFQMNNVTTMTYSFGKHMCVCGVDRFELLIL